MPHIRDLIAYNATLLPTCEADGQRPHYQHGIPIHTLFVQDRQALRALPAKPFEPYRYTRVKTNGYGHFSMDGAHWYSTAPEYAQQTVVVRIGAHIVEPLAGDGSPITTHRRQFGKERTDSTDYRTTVQRLLHNPGAWRNSGVREILPDALKTALDQAPRAVLKDALQAMVDLTNRYDWDHAVRALDTALEQGRFTYDQAIVVAQRLAEWDTLPQDAQPVDLAPYDRLLIGGPSV